MGLLQRVQQYLQQINSVKELHEKSNDDWETKGNFTEEERTQILGEINAVLDQNRLRVDSDTFKIHSQKRGWILPLMINLLAIVFVLVSFFILRYIMKPEERVQESIPAELLLTEARLLEEVRRESQDILSQKDDELENIRQQLADLEVQKQTIQVEFEEQIEEYKNNITLLMEDAIAQEIQRLRDEGYAEEEIDRRISIYRADQTREMDRLIAQERARLEAEKESREAALAGLRNQFETELDSINEEKAALASEYQQRLDDMEAQLEERSNEQQEALGQAQLELAELAEQRELEESVRNQVSGFYASVNDYIQREEYDQALETLDLFEQYIQGPAYGSVSSVLQNLESDKFLINSLTNYVGILSGQNGQQPQIALDIARINRFNQLVEQGHGDFADSRWDDALDNYRAAMDELPEEYLQDEMLENMSALHWRIEQDRQIQQETLQSMEILDQAETLLLQGQENEALALYGTIAQRFPYSQENSTLTDRVASIFQSREEQQLSQWQEQRQELENSLLTQGEEIARKEEELLALDESLILMNDQLALLQQDISQKEEIIALLESDDSAALLEEVTAQLVELQAQAQSWSEMESRMERISIAYGEYTQQEDSLFDDGVTPQELIQGKEALNRFLNAEEIETLMPGLSQRLKTYDQAFQDSGQEAITQELADLIFIYSTLSSPEDRAQWVDREIERSSSNDKIEFLENLRLLAGQNL